MTFIPERSSIASITQANPCVVTTEEDHNLTTGQVVRLHVPKPYGMDNLNNGVFSVTVLSDISFSLQFSQVPVARNVSSLTFPAFVIPSNPQFTAEVLPVGSGPTTVLDPPVYLQNNVCVTSIEDATFNNSTTEIPF